MEKYWVYVHDLDGNLVIDWGTHFSLDSAVAAADFALEVAKTRYVIRIVDENNDSTTMWIAGPVSYMKKYFSEQDGN